MEELIRKFTDKMSASGLAAKDAPIMGVLDADVAWSRNDRLRPVLEEIFGKLNINSLLFSEPAEPYRSMIDFLAGRSEGDIQPRDTETRTFFHSLPVITDFTAEAVLAALRRRKSAIIPGCGIVTFGTVSPEQAFITFSSVCFSCFVKFFSDALAERRRGIPDRQRKGIFEKAAALIEREAASDAEPPESCLAGGPFHSEGDVLEAIETCGLLTVRRRLVDSYFGNISYLLDKTLYISETSSSLDELRGAVDPCPLDGSSCAGMTASSELTAHREIVLKTGNRAVLHGHPKFPVILSMDCSRTGCSHSDACHRDCPEERAVGDIPIVPGEVGTGPFGLCNTVPPAVENRRGVIVYGHGVFTVGKDDFRESFRSLREIDELCRTEYFKRME